MGQTTQKVFQPLSTPADIREELGLAGSRYHDESRQGEAYATQPSVETAQPQKTAYIETYGCQMNFSDTEIVASILTDMGYGFSKDELTADIVLLNTCSIRENAETKVWNRLHALKHQKQKNPGRTVGLLGCMAERLKKKLLEEDQLVDLVVGPDAYRSLPELIGEVESGQKAVNVILSREETYADLAPVRLDTNGVSAFVSIMRGCDNMCSFCVVPFTRGRERSRPWQSIVQECRDLSEKGYKEVTLLGQNVDSYREDDCSFAQLLERVAQVDPEMRVRFSTSHPKDITEDVLHTMAAYDNVCNYIHLPVQSGNSRILEKMNRGYTREWYFDLVERIRKIVPGCGISTDIITGFCSETEEEHMETISLMERVQFDFAYMFYYSERPGTLAARKYPDDVSLEDKKRRLNEVIELQMQHSAASNLRDIDRTYRVLIEGNSKRSDQQFCGRNDANKMVVFDKPADRPELGPGSYVNVRITDVTRATLKGQLV